MIWERVLNWNSLQILSGVLDGEGLGLLCVVSEGGTKINKWMSSGGRFWHGIKKASEELELSEMKQNPCRVVSSS